MISVIMLACNQYPHLVDLTQETINSLEGCDEMIIIDNASSLGGGRMRSSYVDTYVLNKTNIGYPAAVNQGVKLAHGNFYALANNDIRVSDNWQSVAEEIFDEDPKVGSVHFKMIGYDEPMALGRDTWITGKERWCHASFFVIRKEALPKGGYFEGYTKGGYDDYDLFHQMRDLNGWKQAYTNKAVFQHADSSTYRALDDGRSRDERDKNNREIYKNRWGEYPDIQFAQLFPQQMNIPWKPFA